METLEHLAASINIDPAILKQVYQNGYSQGWDDAMDYNKSTEEEFDQLEMFTTQKHLGQKE